MRRKDSERRFFGSLIFLALWILFASSAQAKTIFVGGDSTYQDIQEAIDTAKNGDEIIVRDGTYSPPNANGIDFKGKAVTLRSENGPDNCIIDGGGTTRGFYFHSSETTQSKIDGFTLRSCRAVDGGAVYCQFSSPAITNCILSGNSALYGGAIFYISHYTAPSSPTISNCTFTGNNANYYGGAIHFSSSVFPTITNCTFSGNSAPEGGGIFCNGSISRTAPAITNCTFTDNTADHYGGGINSNEAALSLINCTFTGNWAYFGGGGIYNFNHPGPWTIKNCIFQRNYTKDNFGGGIWLANSSPIITNCTFTDNWTTYDSGDIYQDSNSIPIITNCILWGSWPNQISKYGSKVVTYSNVQGGFPGEGNIDADPRFKNASSGDFHLQEGSPCIDAGTNTASSIPEKDKDGANRIIDGNGDGAATVDMGAYEYLGTPTAIRLASFKAVAGDVGTVTVRWRTASETDNAGFRLWRSHHRNGKYARLTNRFMPAKGTVFKGAKYRFDDLSTRHGKIYFYKLEDVDYEGKSTLHGPVRVRVK